MLAIIPARGGSKGLPGKNIRSFRGAPLLSYAIAAAQGSPLVDRIVLSTDDPEIAAVGQAYGAEVPFLRPSELATDASLAVDTYIYTIDRLNAESGSRVEEFVVLQPTSPLRTAEDVTGAIALFRERGAASVIGVSRMAHPPSWACRLDPQGRLRPWSGANEPLANRQEAGVAYAPNGAVFVLTLSLLKSLRSYYSDNTFAYVMPRERSVDIDDALDFDIAEYLHARSV